MHETPKRDQSVVNVPPRDEEWSTCPNVDSLCPGCMKPIHAIEPGLYSCGCIDVYWRRHPMAMAEWAPWQVIFRDDMSPC